MRLFPKGGRTDIGHPDLDGPQPLRPKPLAMHRNLPFCWFILFARGGNLVVPTGAGHLHESKRLRCLSEVVPDFWTGCYATPDVKDGRE